VVVKIPKNLEMKSPLPAPRLRTSFSRHKGHGVILQSVVEGRVFF
jgi:hypothetical protein